MHGGGLSTGSSHSAAPPGWFLIATRFCASLALLLLVVFGVVAQCAVFPANMLANGLATIDDWEQLRTGSSTREMGRVALPVEREGPAHHGGGPGEAAPFHQLASATLATADAVVPVQVLSQPSCEAAFPRYIARAPPVRS